MLAFVLALQAADGPVAAAALTPCTVFDAAPRRAARGGAGDLIGVCNGRGAPIGPADSYSTVTNIATGSTVIVRRRLGRTQVLLISPTQGGVAVDDVTRDLAKRAGRFGDLGLGTNAVDTSRFAIDGSIGIAGTDGAQRLDLGPYIRLAATLATGTVAAVTGVGGN